MEVNLSKTEAVVFRPQGRAFQAEWQWTYQGQPVPISAQFKYLGIIFHETAGVAVAEGVLCGAARRAMWAMLGRFRVAQIADLSLKLRMYQSLVVPIMEYCSAFWSPALLQNCSSHARVFQSSMQEVQNTFLRQLGHLRSTTPLAVMHRECCLEPVASVWLRSLVQLWQRLQEAPATSLLGRVARAALHLAQSGNSRVKRQCWAGQFFGMLKSFARSGGEGGARLVDFADRCGWTAPRSGAFLHVHQKLLDIPWCSLWNAWYALVLQPWQDLPLQPREVPEGGPIKYTTYHRWFALPLPEELFQWAAMEGSPRMPVHMPAYVKCSRGVPPEHLKQLMRLRTGAHHLAVETGRWGQRVPRGQRWCQKCSAHAVEDALHLLFECPAYQHIRSQYAHSLFSLLGGIDITRNAVQEPGGFCMFMEQSPKQVAAFVNACFALRREEAEPASSGSAVYTDAASSWLLSDSQAFVSADSVFSDDADEVTSMPMEPGLAPETGAPLGANL